MTRLGRLATTLGLGASAMVCAATPSAAGSPPSLEPATVAFAAVQPAPAPQGQAEPLPQTSVWANDAIEPPMVNARAAADTPVAQRRISGPGNYDVVVVGVDTALGKSPATAANSKQVIDEADAIWNKASLGRYRLDYRSFLPLSMPGTTCSLDTLSEAMDPALRALTSNGQPRPGRAGILVVASIPWDDACGYAGLGWYNQALHIANGATYWQYVLVSHEVGHSFGLGHTHALGCATAPPDYPAAQKPQWPCQADERSPGGDWSSTFAGGSRLPAHQLRQLGVLPESDVKDVDRTASTFDLSPIDSGSPGVRTLRLAVPGSTFTTNGTNPPTQLTLEYRSSSAAGISPGVYLDAHGDSRYSETWVYRGSSTDRWNPKYGMTAGTRITLADHRTVDILSTGATAKVRVSAGGITFPAAPELAAITATSAGLEARFTPPADDGGSVITGYQSSVDGGTTWSEAFTGTTRVIEWLGKPYTYKVAIRAVNAAGPGPASPVHVRTVKGPAAPTNAALVARRDDWSPEWDSSGWYLSVEFSAPPNDGGAPTQDYEASTDGGETWFEGASPTSTPERFQLAVLAGSELQFGTRYTIMVRAYNGAGSGDATTVSGIAHRPPDAPTSPRASVSGDGAALSWAAPAFDGGSPILRYRIDDAESGMTWFSTSTTAKLTSADLSAPHVLTVVAVNVDGAGPASEQVWLDPVPPGPTHLRVSGFPAAGAMKLSWRAPKNTHVYDYRVRHVAVGAAAAWSSWTVAKTTSARIGGLQPGRFYRVQVIASTADGMSPPTQVQVRQASPPTPVRDLRSVATRANHAAVLVWRASADTGGSPISGYRIRVSTADIRGWNPWTFTAAAGRTTAALTPGRTYRVQVRAVNSQGVSAPTQFTFRAR